MIIGKPKKTIGASIRSIILILSLRVVRYAIILHYFCEEFLKFASVNRKHFAGVLFGKFLYCHVVTIPHGSDKSKSFFVFIYDSL